MRSAFLPGWYRPVRARPKRAKSADQTSNRSGPSKIRRPPRLHRDAVSAPFPGMGRLDKGRCCISGNLTEATITGILAIVCQGGRGGRGPKTALHIRPWESRDMDALTVSGAMAGHGAGPKASFLIAIRLFCYV